MQLRTARLCLDCEEVHDARQCPACASETFAFITRWVPAPERRTTPRPATVPGAEASRHQSTGDGTASTGRRLLKRGVVGLTAVGLAGWFWRSRTTRPPPRQP